MIVMGQGNLLWRAIQLESIKPEMTSHSFSYSKICINIHFSVATFEKHLKSLLLQVQGRTRSTAFLRALGIIMPKMP